MKNFIKLLTLLALFSCQKESVNVDNGNPNDTIPEEVAITFCDSLLVCNITDQELFDTAYSDFRFYEGFFKEEDEGSLGLMNHNRANQSGDLTILCTDDLMVAEEWSESSALNSSYYRELISQSETEKYFKFQRVNPDRDTDIVLDLILKCSYIDCSNQKVNDNDIFEIGTFKQTPYTIENCLELVEFWKYQGYYNIGNVKVIANAICETDDVIQIALFETVNIYGDWDEKDIIELRKLVYTIYKENGLFTLKTTKIHEIEGIVSTPWEG